MHEEEGEKKERVLSYLFIQAKLISNCFISNTGFYPETNVPWDFVHEGGRDEGAEP
jgi:hypothetical protein